MFIRSIKGLKRGKIIFSFSEIFASGIGMGKGKIIYFLHGFICVIDLVPSNEIYCSVFFFSIYHSFEISS